MESAEELLPRGDAATKKLTAVVALWRSEDSKKQQIRLPRFPEFGLVSVMKLLKLFPSLPDAAALHSAFPWTVLQLSSAQRAAVQSALKLHNVELPGTDRQVYSLKSIEKLPAEPRSKRPPPPTKKNSAELSKHVVFLRLCTTWL